MNPDPYLFAPNTKINLHGIEFPAEYLFRHLLITGAPGAGKTRLVLLPLLDQILSVFDPAPSGKPSLIIADPKGELHSLLQPLLEKYGRLDDLVILETGASYYNPLSNPFLTQTELVEKLIAFAKNASRSSQADAMQQDSIYWENSMRNLLSALAAVARINPRTPGVFTMDDLSKHWDKLSKYSSRGAMQEWLVTLKEQPNAAARRTLLEYGGLPDVTRACVCTSVSNVLYPWGLEPLKSLVTPKANLHEIDPLSIVDNGKILLISCSGPAYGTSITPLLTALKEHLFASILSRNQIDVVEDGSTRLINQSRPIFVIADEFQSYMSNSHSSGEITALDRLRGFRCGYIAASQNLSSIYSVLNGDMHGRRLLALFSNQLFMNNIDISTADYAFSMLCQTLPLFDDPHVPLPHSLRENLPPPNARYTPGALATLKTGEFWLRLASGTIHRGTSHNLQQKFLL